MRAAYVAEGLSASTLRSLNYTPEVDSFRRLSESRASVALRDLLAKMGDSYGKVFVRYDCAREYGEELITQGDMFAAEPEGRIIRGDALPRIEDHRIERLDVLISGAGTLGETELFGRSIMADARLAGRIVGPHAMKLTFSDPESDTALYAYAFLNTRVGIRIVRATGFGTKILGLRKDLLRSVPIPLPTTATQRRVADMIRTTVAGRESYLQEVRAARACIEALPEMQEATSMSQERKARCVLWSGALPTLTGWTYGSAGESLALLQRSWGARLGDVVRPESIFNGPRFARVGCVAPHGVNFLSQRDLFLIRPIPRRIVNPGLSERQLFTHPASLLVGGHGTLGEGEIFGRTTFVSDDLARFALTQDMLRIWPEADFAEVLYAFLSTLVGFRLMRSTAVGTKILSLRTDLMRALPIPDLSSDLHARVTTHVRAAMSARAAASAAEREAIRIVEEEVLPEWLA